jgi:hypothetical protein
MATSLVRRAAASLAALLALGLSAGAASAQCLLANPSFELPGSGGAVFGGWNQFGLVRSSSDAAHGSRSARVTGPNQGGWDVSGFWQRLDSAPGDRWSASVSGWHPAAKPLVGDSRAILNIEWRTAAGALISYESHTVADASTPADAVQEFSVVSGPAPAGTGAVHLLLGVLQAPTAPQPDVVYDIATFEKVGPPSLDDVQWSDFPGGRTLSFGGRTWRVKGPGFFGPGPNSFSDATGNVWVDAGGRLHLTVKNVSGTWYSTEVTLEEALGYGDYIFTTVGRLDLLDPAVVFGLFLWQYGHCWDPAYGWWNPNNEIDVEFSRWGNAGNDIGQFVAQPYDHPGNISRFNATFGVGELTSHAFRWLPDRVEYRSWRGGPADEATGPLIHSWSYTGPHIPRPEQPRVHLNLWRFAGPPAANQEVVLDDFTFVPHVPASGVGDTGSAAPRGALLDRPSPNPFGARTALGFSLTAEGPVDVRVYDAAGRSVRVLQSGFAPAGRHTLDWDGQDDAGRPVASGVYLVQLRAGDEIHTERVVLLR